MGTPGNEPNFKRHTGDGDYVFRRKVQEHSYAIPSLPGPAPAPTLPKIITTQRDTGKGKTSSDRQIGESRNSSRHESNDTSSSPVYAQPRRFQLSRPNTINVHSTTGKRKHRSEDEPDGVAVLVERHIRYAPNIETDIYAVDKDASKQQASQASPKKFKRPGVSARLNGTANSFHKAPQTIDPKVHEIVGHLAAEEQPERATGQNGQNVSDLKVDPARKADSERVQDADEEEYVFDTFVRHLMDPAGPSYDATAERVGYLVIENEDQELWETYADADLESEKDWDSEQDDENGVCSLSIISCMKLTDFPLLAENYYGADYPEDELDFEDEYDEDPYKYRHGTASDEEEYDLENDVWSDDESSSESGNTPSWHKSDSLRTPIDLNDDTYMN